MCGSELKIKNHGLECTTSGQHRGFITTKQAADIKSTQLQNQNQLEEYYKIVNGKVELK